MQELKGSDISILFPTLDSHTSSCWSSEVLGCFLALWQCCGSFPSTLLLHPQEPDKLNTGTVNKRADLATALW